MTNIVMEASAGLHKLQQKMSDMSWKMSFMKCWNVAGALVRPIGMTRNSNDLYHVRKAVFHSWPAAIQTL